MSPSSFPILCLVSAVNGLVDQESREAEYADPARFEDAIRAFESSDEKHMPPKGAIVVIGSSSIGCWHETICDDLSPLTIIPRGFGGSNMNDALHYAERMIVKYQPRAIVLYEGDNDIGAGIPPMQVMDRFLTLTKLLHQNLPELRIYVMSIKPSPSRWPLWSTVQQTNAMLREACARDERFTYIDVGVSMLNEQGTPKEHIFRDDKLHMNEKGYVLWKASVMKTLIRETVHESP